MADSSMIGHSWRAKVETSLRTSAMSVAHHVARQGAEEHGTEGNLLAVYSTAVDSLCSFFFVIFKTRWSHGL